MGIPIVQAPCEAEAQCAALVRHGKAFATATEDMDALTFGSNILLRQLLARYNFVSTIDNVFNLTLKKFFLNFSVGYLPFLHLF